MRGTSPACVLLVAVAAAGCATARPLPAPYPGAPVVRALDIEGTRQLDPDTIRAHLATAVTGRWPWSTVQRFDPVTWDEDLLRIARFYASEGFYGAAVVSSAVERRSDGVALRATVREGEPTHLAELEISGLAAVPDDVRREAEEKVRLRVGRRFREEDWTATKAGILGILRSAGYAEAAVAGEVRVAPGARVARARVEVATGERFEFGAVRLATPAPPGVAPDAIVAEAAAALARERWYRPAALEAAQTRVFRMGAFSAVSVTGGPPDHERRLVPVVVGVRAGPSTTARVAAGVTLFPARDDVHVTGEVVDRHIGGLRTLRLRGRGGWAWVPSLVVGATSRTAGRNGPVALASLDADQPRLLSASGLHAYAAVDGEIGLEEAYRFAAVRPRAGISLALGGTSIDLSYGFEGTRLLDTSLGRDPAYPIAYGCAGGCTLGFAQLRTVWDSRGAEASLTGYQRASARVRAASTLLGGAHDLIQVLLEGETTHPLVRGKTLLGRAHLTAGTVIPIRARTAPVVARLAGGGDQMRGMSYGRLSPMLVLPRAGGAAAEATGGQGLLEGGLGLSRAITTSLSLELFADAGATSVQPFDPGRLLARLLYDVGVGMSFTSLVGTLRVDLAYRLPVGPALPQAPAPGTQPPAIRSPACFGLFGGARSRAGAPEPPCVLQIMFGTSS